MSMTEQSGQPVEEFTTVQAIYVRKRNCLLLRADFSPLFVDYYLHLMQHKQRNAEAEDTMFKQLLAFFTLHLVSRPWQEYHAWTLNIREPMLANYFVSGSSLTEDVIGRVFTKDVRTNRMNGKEVTRGKGYEGLKLHELRHTQATLIQGAVNPKAAQHRLGHSQISMTMNTYAHALDADEIAAAEAMDRILNSESK